MVPWETLVEPEGHGDGDRAGFVDGEPVPGDLVREMIASSQGKVWWRRLFTMPSSDAWAGNVGSAQEPAGQKESSTTGVAAPPRRSGPSDDSADQPRVVVGGDRVRRRFDGWLAAMIRARDQRCRDPFCDAPIRHLDHIERHADGGPSTDRRVLTGHPEDLVRRRTVGACRTTPRSASSSSPAAPR